MLQTVTDSPIENVQYICPIKVDFVQSCIERLPVTDHYILSSGYICMCAYKYTRVQ